MSANLINTIKSLESVSLDEMKRVSLMNRFDTKFICHKKLLDPILENLKGAYKVLEIEGKRAANYKNLYFDTEKLKFYTDHHNGKGHRTKVRMREYADTQVCYIEVKKKDNKGSTKKIRKRIEGFGPVLTDECLDFVGALTPIDLMHESVLFNKFNRITLVNKEEQERVTLDFNLSFKSDTETIQYDDLAVIEAKQAALSRSSAIFECLKSIRVNPYRISKYCIGMSALRADVKTNRFKEKLREINKITNT